MLSRFPFQKFALLLAVVCLIISSTSCSTSKQSFSKQRYTNNGKFRQPAKKNFSHLDRGQNERTEKAVKVFSTNSVSTNETSAISDAGETWEAIGYSVLLVGGLIVLAIVEGLTVLEFFAVLGVFILITFLAYLFVRYILLWWLFAWLDAW